MSTNMKIYGRAKIYAKTSVSDTDTMYFNQKTKENDATHFLKETHQEFVGLLS